MSEIPRIVSGEHLHYTGFSATTHPFCRAAGSPTLHVVRFASLLSLLLILVAACTPAWIRAGDTVYVLGSHGVDPVSHNELISIAAVSAADGHLRWRHVVPRDYWDGLTLFAAADDMLFIPTDGPISRPGEGPPPTGSLVALGASDGRQIWRTEIGAFASVPVVTGGTVYVGAQHAAARSSHIYALDAATGKVRWHVELPHVPPAGLISDLVFSGGIVYAQAQQFCFDSCPNPVAYLVALRATDGAMVWENTIPATVIPLTFFDGRLLTIGISDPLKQVVDTLVAYDAANGKQVWSVSISAVTQRKQPLVADHTVYVLEGSDTLAAFDSRSGTPRWSASVPGGKLIGMDNAAVYVGGVYSTALVAIARQTGKQIWRADLPEKPFDELLRHGMLYVTTTVHDTTANDKWTVYAVRGSDGKRLWQADVPLTVAPSQSQVAALAASDDAVYVVGRNDHFVTARQANGGAVKWTYTSTDAIRSAFVP